MNTWIHNIDKELDTNVVQILDVFIQDKKIIT